MGATKGSGVEGDGASSGGSFNSSDDPLPLLEQVAHSLSSMTM